MKFLCSQTAVLVLVTLSCTEPVQSQNNGPGFVLSVHIHRYINPAHRLGMSIENRCCDSNETSDCVDPCDNTFFFCLRPYGYPQQADDCPLGNYTVEAFCVSSDVEERDCDMLLFNSSDNSFGSAPNPLIFSGDSWPGGFQLLTEVEDQDDFVDRIIAEQWLSPESGNTIQMEFPGEFNSGFLRMSFKVVCNENFGGLNCTTYCGVEGCTPERAFCREPGVCVCLDGNGGDDCTIALDPCSPSPCQNGGSCVSAAGSPSQYSCQCVEGFEGDSCDEPLNATSNSVSPAVIGGTVVTVIVVVIVTMVLLLVAVLLVKRRQKSVTATGAGMQQDTIEIMSNPAYGISRQQTSQQSPGETEYYVNEGMGPDNYVYDYVVHNH